MQSRGRSALRRSTISRSLVSLVLPHRTFHSIATPQIAIAVLCSAHVRSKRASCLTHCFTLPYTPALHLRYSLLDTTLHATRFVHRTLLVLPRSCAPVFNVTLELACFLVFCSSSHQVTGSPITNLLNLDQSDVAVASLRWALRSALTVYWNSLRGCAGPMKSPGAALYMDE